MNIIQKIVSSIFGISTKTQTLYPIDPENIRKDAIIKAQAQSNAAKDVQLAKILADQREEQEKIKEEDLETDFINRTNEQKALLKDEKFGIPMSFKRLFTTKRVFNNIELADKDDKIIFGKLGDIVTLENGTFGILDSENNLVNYGSNIGHVIHKPGTLLNQIKRGRILLAVDKDRRPAIDLEEITFPEISYDSETEEYKHSEQLFVKYKDAIIQREDQIREMGETIEKLEKVVIDLRRKLADLERANRIHLEDRQVSQVGLSKAMEMTLQFKQHIGEMQSKITSLTESKAMYEKIIAAYEKINSELLAKAESLGVKGDFEKIYEHLKETIEWAKDNTPETIIQQIHPEPPKREVAQPGQKFN